MRVGCKQVSIKEEKVDMPVPPGFVSLTSSTLRKMDESEVLMSNMVSAGTNEMDCESDMSEGLRLKRSLKHKPWINYSKLGDSSDEESTTRQSHKVRVKMCSSFFESMGFKCMDRKGVADFLQEVTSKKDQHQYWAHKDEPYTFITSKDFTQAFQSSHVGQRLGEELATPFNKSMNHPAALTTKKYGVSKTELLKACASREYLLMKRNSFVYIFKLFQLMFMAFVTITLFLRTEMKRDTVVDGGIYMGALFFTLVMIMFNGFSELAMAVVKFPVFYKQRDLLFYPAWAYSLPTWILKIPITFVEVGAGVFMTYYVIGFDPNVERFLIQYFLLLFINQMAAGLFRAAAAVGRNMIVANTIGSFVLLILLSLGGFVLNY